MDTCAGLYDCPGCDSYVKEIYRKLNVSSRAEAALTAHNFGLV